MSKKSKIIIGIVVIFALLFVLKGMKGGKRPAAKPADTAAAEESMAPVQVESVAVQDMTATIEVTGSLKALNDVSLSAKIPGKVVDVNGHEGDHVRAGQVVVQQDPSDLAAQVRQAEAALQAAVARLKQAKTGAKLQVPQVDTGIGQAKAALNAAKARLAIVKQGARSQERLVAQNSVDSAKASMDNAKLNLDRVRKLFSQGAVSKQALDLAEMQYTTSSNQYDSARQQLSLVQVGARPEEIDAAVAAVAQAEEAYRMAKASRGQIQMREDDILAAQAGVSQAKANLAYAQQQLANAAIRTPIDGTIAKRMTEPGQMAAAGVSLMQIVGLNSVYFEATVSETEMAQIKLGQPASVRIDAFADKTFQGRVTKILPTADQLSRRFEVWIAVTNPGGVLRPGMFARGDIQTSKHTKSLVVAKRALVERGTETFAFMVDGNIAHERKVGVGITNGTQAEIVSGLKAGDKVVVLGQDGLQDGAKVFVRE